MSHPVSTAARACVLALLAALTAAAPAHAALYFTVARLPPSTGAALPTPTTAIAPGATAYIRVDGLGKVKTSAAVGAETDWLATWLTPSGGTACANTGGGDRPNSTVAGVLPDIAGSFLQYRPNSPDAGDQWNFESKYETRPCADTSAHGEWRLKLQKDATHFVTLDAFLFTVLTPASLDAAPARPS